MGYDRYDRDMGHDNQAIGRRARVLRFANLNSGLTLAKPGHGEFSNGDGFLDLVCQFKDDPHMCGRRLRGAIAD